MEFRVGVSLSDVMAEGEQICGDDINVAARSFFRHEGKIKEGVQLFAYAP